MLWIFKLFTKIFKHSFVRMNLDFVDFEMKYLYLFGMSLNEVQHKYFDYSTEIGAIYSMLFFDLIQLLARLWINFMLRPLKRFNIWMSSSEDYSLMDNSMHSKNPCLENSTDKPKPRLTLSLRFAQCGSNDKYVNECHSFQNQNLMHTSKIDIPFIRQLNNGICENRVQIWDSY